jgi:hypothetical protein
MVYDSDSSGHSMIDHIRRSLGHEVRVQVDIKTCRKCEDAKSQHGRPSDSRVSFE